LRKTLNTLMTCGSGPGVVGHIDALRRNRYASVRVVVGDVSTDENVGFALADDRATLPAAYLPDMSELMLEVCRGHHADVLWPVFDGELEPLSAARAKFEAEGIRLLMADDTTIRLCLDKAAFHQRLAESGLVLPCQVVRSPVALRQAAESFGYPQRHVAIKPNRGAGGRGFHVLHGRLEPAKTFFSDKPDSTACVMETAVEALTHWSQDREPAVLVSPFVGGPEYGCDVLAEGGRIVAAVTRAKLPPVREGMHTRIVVGEDPGVLSVVERLVEALGATGLLSVDLRADEQGRLWVLEVNPRAGAYLGMACELLDLMGLSLARLFGDRTNVEKYRRESEDVMGLRYWADMVLVRGRPRVMASCGVEG